MITRRTVLQWLAGAAGGAVAGPTALAGPAPAGSAAPPLGSHAALLALPVKWFFETATGTFEPARDVFAWMDWHIPEEVLEQARRGLVESIGPEQLRGLRLRKRRLQCIEIHLPYGTADQTDNFAPAESLVRISRWRENGGDLRPFFKALGLAHEGTTVELINMRRAARERRGLANAQPVVRWASGTDFLHGDLLNGEIALDELVARWQRRHEPRAADWSPATTGWWMPRWPQLPGPGIPWAALEAAWTLVEPLECPNCDEPTILAGFGHRRISFLGYDPRREFICPTCRRRHVAPLDGLVERVRAVPGMSA